MEMKGLTKEEALAKALEIQQLNSQFTTVMPTVQQLPTGN
jgi:hypothetical protein